MYVWSTETVTFEFFFILLSFLSEKWRRVVGSGVLYCAVLCCAVMYGGQLFLSRLMFDYDSWTNHYHWRVCVVCACSGLPVAKLFFCFVLSFFFVLMTAMAKAPHTHNQSTIYMFSTLNIEKCNDCEQRTHKRAHTRTHTPTNSFAWWIQSNA